MNNKLKRELPLYLMLVIPLLIIIIYAYFPMFGITMAFKDFIPSRYGFIYSLVHSKFVGLDIYKYVINNPDSFEVVRNTFFIASMKIVVKLFFPLLFALMLNEVAKNWFRKLASTITYMPFLLSWVVIGGILLDFFSPQGGSFNQILAVFHMKPTFFFGTASQFPFAIVLSDLWKEIGYNTTIFLAAMISVDISLYESAMIDGAGRWKQTMSVTLPSIAPLVALVAILSLGNIVNAGQDQIMNLYGPAVYSTGDIIDTYAYRMGIQQGMYSVATAVGLFKSLVSFIMISLSYYMANKYSNYKVF